MIVKALKTHKITSQDKDIFQILDKYLDKLEENSVIAVTSKIVSITEGSTAEFGHISKEDLVKQEAEYYLPKTSNKYDVSFTIKNNVIVASSGIDETNGNGFYILWPKNPFESANKIRKFLKEKNKLQNLGVIITDSKTTPLRWGVTGFALSYSGISPVKNYIGKIDLFGRKFEYTKTSIIDGLAASAVLTMGEGSEQTPIAKISDIPFVEFVERDPTQEEVNTLKIEIQDDLYAPILNSVKWEKGQG